MTKPIILVTNDDGMFAPGIKCLVSIVKELGTPIVVAPDSPQSGQGHAITITQPLRLNKVDVFGDVEAYECSGTPVDCVKLAKNVVLKDEEVALCVSGINHGSNASINIIYSGTMSAAMEASLEGVPSIGFSLLDYSFHANFEASRPFVKKIIEFALDHRFKNSKLLNVNIPNLPREEIRGIKICRQGEGNWVQEFKEAKDPRGQKYYWLTGKFIAEEESTDTDIWALENGYISVVPSGHDLTSYPALNELSHMEEI